MTHDREKRHDILSAPTKRRPAGVVAAPQSGEPGFPGAQAPLAGPDVRISDVVAAKIDAATDWMDAAFGVDA